MASSKDFVGKLRSLRDKDSGVGTRDGAFCRAVQYVSVCDQTYNIKRIMEVQYCREKRDSEV